MKDAIALNSREWSAKGIEPPVGDEIYTAGEQPIASHDNWWNYSVSLDLKNLNGKLGDHAAMHEAGGQQPIDLHNLGVNTVARFYGDQSNDEFWLVDSGDKSSVARIDVGNDKVRQWPAFAITPSFDAGLVTADDITAPNGSRLYDAVTQKWENAKHADEADHALSADNADSLNGDADYLQSGDSPTITGTWTYDNAIDADILGNAATADTAGTADSATNADHATTAGDADTVDGDHSSDIVAKAKSQIVDGHSVSNNGTEILPEPTDVNFGDGVTAVEDTSSGVGDGTISVTAGTSSDPVANADFAQTAQNADTVDDYHADQLIDEAAAQSSGFWTKLAYKEHTDPTTEFDFHWQAASSSEIYDRYRIIFYAEHHDTSDQHQCFNVRVNGDGRNRYYSTEIVRGPEWNTTDMEPEVEQTVEARRWWFGEVRGGSTATGVYDITCPQTVNDPGHKYVHFANRGDAAMWNPKSMPLWGELQTEYANVDELRFWRSDLTGKIIIYGHNLPSS